MALTPGGFVFSWGLNVYGLLGHGDNVDRSEPALVKTLANTQIVQISAGYLHSGAVAEDGSLYTWGHNPDCRLLKAVKKYSMRQDTTRNYSIPQYCDALAGKAIVEVSCGATHTVAIDNDGCVYSGGSPEWGQLGVPQWEFQPEACVTPYVEVAPFRADNPAVKVRAGDGFSVALDLRGQVWMCGKGNFGRQGNCSLSSINRMRRVDAFRMKRIRIADIAVGGRHTLAISEEDPKAKKKAELFGWGFNFYSQLGLGANARDDCMAPVRIPLPTNQKLKKVSCGYFNSVALTK